ncbi:surfeit locus protein 1 [Nasonia vitripennis]|uniref:SURF1-like protein n=1 Tax=Nasonia vitripennis TaxID=7425 RepID=A0A7M7G892_NASVI|nr:surfeit locus protein 1 [Nasonia vitripennis]
MNSSTYKLCLQLLKCSKTRSRLLLPVNNPQKTLIARTVFTRPKELDELRRRAKQRQEESRERYRQQSHNDDSEEIGPYGFFLFTIPVITFGLGTWQVYRRQWKLGVIKDLEDRLSRDPVELPENVDDLAHLEYCPIKVRGEFLYENEFVIGPRSLIVDGHGANEGKGNLISNSSMNRGYVVITPFKVEDRDLIILVNRGWLPNKYKNPEERKNCRVEGTVEITGINRLTEKRPQFVPKNEPEKGSWHYRDVHQMAEYAHTEPIFLDMLESYPGPNMPIAGQTRLNIRNEHLSYIVTWYALSGLTGWYWFRMFIQKRPIF